VGENSCTGILSAAIVTMKKLAELQLAGIGTTGTGREKRAWQGWGDVRNPLVRPSSYGVHHSASHILGEAAPGRAVSVCTAPQGARGAGRFGSIRKCKELATGEHRRVQDHRGKSAVTCAEDAD